MHSALSIACGIEDRGCSARGPHFDVIDKAECTRMFQIGDWRWLMADVRKASCEVAAMSKPASRPQALQKRLISHANVKTAETYFVFLKNSMGETENNFGKGRTNLGIVVHFPGWQNNLRAGKTFLGARDSFFGGGTAVLGETAKRFPAAG